MGLVNECGWGCVETVLQMMTGVGQADFAGSRVGIFNAVAVEDFLILQ